MSTQNPIFIPGPTNIPEALRRAVDFPSIDHRSTTFAEIFQPLFPALKRILKLEAGEVFVFPATGTGGWEAAVTNVLSPGDSVLAARHGMFSHRWIGLCQRHNLEVEIVEAPWGAGVPADEYERILTADTGHAIKAVLVCHNETATGVRSDVAAVRRAMDAAGHPALLLVDGVSSIASMDFRMDAWGVDIAVAGSQKGFMLPAGLAILGVSPKAIAAIETAENTRCFFDFRDMLSANSVGGFPYTPPINLIRGLGVSLSMLEDEGLDNVFARHHRIACGVRAAVGAWDLTLCAKDPTLYSDTVSAIVVPEDVDAGEIVSLAAQKYGVAFGIGLGEIATKVFRIGHLGSLTDVMTLSGIATAEMVMTDLDMQIKLGSGVAAAQAFYRSGQGG